MLAAQTHVRRAAETFKRPTNHKSNSDLEDFWTESIASTQTIISEVFARPRRQKPHRIGEKRNLRKTKWS